MPKDGVLKNVTSRHRERTCRDFVAEEIFTRSGCHCLLIGFCFL